MTTQPGPGQRGAVKSPSLHAEFTAFNHTATQRFAQWRTAAAQRLTAFGQDGHPKALIATIAEELLATFEHTPLLDAYDVYQHLMDYWAESMQDDLYLIAADGWVAQTSRIVESDKKGKSKDRGWTCELIPKPLIVARYFAGQQAAIDAALLTTRALEAPGAAPLRRELAAYHLPELEMSFRDFCCDPRWTNPGAFNKVPVRHMRCDKGDVGD